MTLWGYVFGETWRHSDGAITALINTDGSPRLALHWLEQYLATEASE